jgi:hypothetical protein
MQKKKCNQGECERDSRSVSAEIKTSTNSDRTNTMPRVIGNVADASVGLAHESPLGPEVQVLFVESALRSSGTVGVPKPLPSTTCRMSCRDGIRGRWRCSLGGSKRFMLGVGRGCVDYRSIEAGDALR